jgi:hypothetical protein
MIEIMYFAQMPTLKTKYLATIKKLEHNMTMLKKQVEDLLSANKKRTTKY